MQINPMARLGGIARMAARQLQQRWLESMLILLGIALGVGVFTATGTHIRFSERTIREATRSNYPPCTSLHSVITPAWMRDAGTSAIRLATDMGEPVNFRLSDILTLKEAVPSIDSVFVSEFPAIGSLIAVDTDGTVHDEVPTVWMTITSPDAPRFNERPFVAGTAFS